MIINNNIPALNTYRQMGANQKNNANAMEKLSSGLRINKAGDDAAGLAISEKMRAQVRGLDQASRNSQDGISMIQTAEGALQETQNILQRMRELATQSANDTNVDVDRKEIQKEMNQLTSEINRIGNTTEFNTQKLINGEKANTFTSEVVGMNFVGGSDTEASVAGTGIDVKLLDGANALAEGEHTLDITVDRNTRDVQSLTPTANDLGGTGANAGVVFANNQITADNTTAAETWTMTFDAASNSFTVANAGGTTSDVYNVGEEFNAHGVSFKIEDVGSLTDGQTLTFDTTIGADVIGTESAGYTAGTAQDAVFNGAVTLTDDNQNEISQYAGGRVEIGTTSTDVSVKIYDKDNNLVVDDTLGAATGTYDNHGVKFEITGAATSNDNVITMDIAEDTYTVQGSLNGGAAQTLTSSYDGISTDSVSEFTGFDGIQLDSSAILASGSHTFNVEQTVEESGEDNSLNFQIGANQNQALNLSISDMRSEALGISSKDSNTLTFINRDGIEETVNLTDSEDVTDGTNSAGVERALDVSTHENAAKAITVINNAIESVSSERSKLGANQNRLEHTISNLGTSSENLQAAESRIRDVDMAKEVMEMTRTNILSQASQAMLAQANQKPQSVLQLLG
ncbi:flagellin N-terminal helical domain-containing protein [Bacillus solitudinis]|uniref:flagellin N-terminal helical domain-containing protein n=1 Tax=Bacillus solitudinis TaxID=2014074 RepID=UPI000C23B467|nr:flagellin [Bacillus solitudinis]